MDSRLLRRIRAGVIGDDQVMCGPYGPRRITYADYTASGRALSFIEQVIREEVLPRYANTHTESSSTGRQTTQLREDARRIIHEAVGGDEQTVVIFAGSGSTGAIDKMIGILGIRIPAALEDRYHLSRLIPERERPVVFIGPFEHHSNELPWRESMADVVVIHEDADGHISEQDLEEQLRRYADRPLKIGSFSAASNVTGIVSDTRGISELLHRHGALAFWDYAAAGPYVDINMAGLDAIFLSPHKFVGGPGTPGVLAVRRELLRNRVPVVPGGGTVDYVNAVEHHYLADPAHREEGGTPAIIESIRAGLVFALKQQVGVEAIRAAEDRFLSMAVEAWRDHPYLTILGNLDAPRLSIVSFVVRAPSGRYLHHNFVVALLSDLFGVQCRGGCSCAGPYGHRLLGIDLDRSHRFEQEIIAGCEGIKPGWVRLSFNYFLTDELARYLIDAVDLVARYGWLLLPDYRFHPATGLWTHRDASTGAPVHLADLCCDTRGDLHLPEPPARAPLSALAGYLDEARALFAAREAALGATGADERDGAAATPLSPRLEELRWFELPAECLA